MATDRSPLARTSLFRSRKSAPAWTPCESSSVPLPPWPPSAMTTAITTARIASPKGAGPTTCTSSTCRRVHAWCSPARATTRATVAARLRRAPTSAPTTFRCRVPLSTRSCGVSSALPTRTTSRRAARSSLTSTKTCSKGRRPPLRRCQRWRALYAGDMGRLCPVSHAKRCRSRPRSWRSTIYTAPVP